MTIVNAYGYMRATFATGKGCQRVVVATRKNEDIVKLIHAEVEEALEHLDAKYMQERKQVLIMMREKHRVKPPPKSNTWK